MDFSITINLATPAFLSAMGFICLLAWLDTRR